MDTASLAVTKVSPLLITVSTADGERSMTWRQAREAAGPNNTPDLQAIYHELLKKAREMAREAGLLRQDFDGDSAISLLEGDPDEDHLRFASQAHARSAAVVAAVQADRPR